MNDYEAKMISALQNKTKYKSKFNFDFFLKNKFKFFGVSSCSTSADLPIDALITNVGLILAKIGDFFSRGTDRQTGFRNPHMETCRHTKNFNSKLQIRS